MSAHTTGWRKVTVTCRPLVGKPKHYEAGFHSQQDREGFLCLGCKRTNVPAAGDSRHLVSDPHRKVRARRARPTGVAA